MSIFLPKLSTKSAIDDVIKTTEDVVLVLRFGRETDTSCMQLDEIVSASYSWIPSSLESIAELDLERYPLNLVLENIEYLGDKPFSYCSRYNEVNRRHSKGWSLTFLGIKIYVMSKEQTKRTRLKCIV